MRTMHFIFILFIVGCSTVDQRVNILRYPSSTFDKRISCVKIFEKFQLDPSSFGEIRPEQLLKKIEKSESFDSDLLREVQLNVFFEDTIFKLQDDPEMDYYIVYLLKKYYPVDSDQKILNKYKDLFYKCLN